MIATNNRIINLLIIVFSFMFFLPPQVQTQEPVHYLPGHRLNASVLKFTPDGKFAVSGSVDSLILWNLSNGKSVWTYKKVNNWVRSLAISPDQKLILMSDGSRQLALIDFATGSVISSVKSKDISFALVDMAITPDNLNFVAAQHGGAVAKDVQVWDLKSLKPTKNLKGHTKNIISLDLSKNGKYVISGSKDTTARLWDIETGKTLKILAPQKPQKGPSPKEITQVLFINDDSMAITTSSSGEGIIRIWDIENGIQLRTLKLRNSKGIQYAAVSPDGLSLLVNRSKTIELWNTALAKPIWTRKADQNFSSIAVSQDFSSLALGLSAPKDRRIKVMEL